MRIVYSQTPALSKTFSLKPGVTYDCAGKPVTHESAETHAADCRRVFINVVRAGTKGFLATIAFGWGAKAFYRKWMKAAG